MQETLLRIQSCTNICGPANTGKYFRGSIFETCICTFAPSRIHAPFGEFASVRRHVVHASAPGRMQENIPVELFMYWFHARGYVAEREKDYTHVRKQHCRTEQLLLALLDRKKTAPEKWNLVELK